jgi:hypothetical protein
MTAEITATLYLRVHIADEATFLRPVLYEVATMPVAKTFAAVGTAADWLGRRADDVAEHALRLFHDAMRCPTWRAGLLADMRAHNGGHSCLHITVDVHVEANGKRYARQDEGFRFSSPPEWTGERLDHCLAAGQRMLGHVIPPELVAKIIRVGAGRFHDEAEG